MKNKYMKKCSRNWKLCRLFNSYLYIWAKNKGMWQCWLLDKKYRWRKTIFIYTTKYKENWYSKNYCLYSICQLFSLCIKAFNMVLTPTNWILRKRSDKDGDFLKQEMNPRLFYTMIMNNNRFFQEKNLMFVPKN